LQIFASLELLVSLDKGDGKLPIRANYPQWSVVVNQALILDIPAIVINGTNMT
jgi:pyrimidine operon attenuation protein/uracil phosphoribosyltransferase